MTPGGIGWRGWAVAGLGALGVLAAVLALFRRPAAPRGLVPERAIAAQLDTGLVRLRDNEDGLLKEDANLRDPTPLFLPTRWNAAENALPPGARRLPGASIEGVDDRAKLTFPDAELNLHLPAAVLTPRRPADAFATDKPSAPFGGFGETDARIAPLAGRAAFVEVVSAATGQLMMAEPLTDARVPPGGSWQPLEFLVAIDAAGIVRPPVLTESSRVPAVDAYFQQYLGGELHVGARLSPGLYRVCFGP